MITCVYVYVLHTCMYIRLSQSHALIFYMHSMIAAINCGSPSEPDNGAVTFTSTTFQSQATFTCDSGYSLEGSSSRTCQSDGTWSGQAPVCNRGIYMYTSSKPLVFTELELYAIKIITGIA